MKVYIVISICGYCSMDETTGISNVFGTFEKAKKYVEDILPEFEADGGKVKWESHDFVIIEGNWHDYAFRIYETEVL